MSQVIKILLFVAVATLFVAAMAVVRHILFKAALRESNDKDNSYS